MPIDKKPHSPPYATFTTFTKLLNDLRERGIPARIDPSVFGSASGSIVYSVLNALKFLHLINEDGVPSDELRQLVEADEEPRKALLRKVMERGYPSLFAQDLTRMTAGQFNDHIRDNFDVQGSTIDKIAAFFLAGCKEAGIEISEHLKKRKAIAPSTGSRKSSKQRKQDGTQDGVDDGDDPPPPAKDQSGKPLEYQLIDLMSEPDIEDEVKTSIWNLVQYLTARKKKTQATN